MSSPLTMNVRACLCIYYSVKQFKKDVVIDFVLTMMRFNSVK